MSDWTSGYVADIAYTYGYYAELNPARFKLPLLYAGIAIPEIKTACELGFGQGISINLHAAASGVSWSGTDFNPAQAAFASELSRASGAQISVHDEAFAEFCARTDLPDFDFIGLHGIWSWISDENRRLIVTFLRQKLKVGGILYISYNTLPGWASFAPMRHLMTRHAEVMGAPGDGIVKRIDGALAFAEKLLAVNPAYAQANPQIADRLSKTKEQNRHYLAHEYFNRDWHPMHFATMAEWLGPAKLSFAGSANYFDYVDGINFTADQQALLKSQPDPMFRESVRDFIVNQQFRKDYWIKGARRLSPLEQVEALQALQVVLVTPRSNVPLKVVGALGEATMSEAIYAPLLDLLADHKVKTIAQLEPSMKAHGVGRAQLLQALLVLAGASHITVVDTHGVTARVKSQTEKLNAYMANKSRSSHEFNFAVSPVTGGGYTLTRFPQLFMQAWNLNKRQPAELAAFAWNILLAQDQKLVKDGKTIDSAEGNMAELTSQAKAFVEQQVPVLKALQIL